MQKKLWIPMMVLLVIPGLLFTLGCQKKSVAVTKAPVEKAPEKAPEKVEPKEPEAAPVVSTPDTSAMIMQENIYFDFDKSNLRPAAQENLTRKAEWLRANPDATVTIEGHCDERGTNEYNLALGDRRAESAKAFLVDLGINASRLTTISYGEERPVCGQQNEECWQKNRRGAFELN